MKMKTGRCKKPPLIETFGTYIVFRNKEEFSELPTNFHFDGSCDNGKTIIRWKTFVGDKFRSPNLKDYSNHSERLLAVSTALIDLDYWAEKLPNKT
jgi:hypothetical protein